MIIDTHCHLDNEAYYEDVEAVIEEALKEGLRYFVIPGANPEDLHRAVELSERYDEVFFSVGVHPYDVDKYDESLLKEYIHHPKCVAVGECGLDYYRLDEQKEKALLQIQSQQEVFIRQIQLAVEYKKPIIVHVREANEDSRRILLDNSLGLMGGVLHCFNGSEHLLPLAEKNFYFGIGGVVTFKNAKKLIQSLSKIPSDKLVIETDSPYLTPTPFRGKRNKPSYTMYVAQKISDILDIELEAIKRLTTQNALKLFKFS